MHLQTQRRSRVSSAGSRLDASANPAAAAPRKNDFDAAAAAAAAGRGSADGPGGGGGVFGDPGIRAAEDLQQLGPVWKGSVRLSRGRAAPAAGQQQPAAAFGMTRDAAHAGMEVLGMGLEAVTEVTWSRVLRHRHPSWRRPARGWSITT